MGSGAAQVVSDAIVIVKQPHTGRLLRRQTLPFTWDERQLAPLRTRWQKLLQELAREPHVDYM